MLRTRKDVPRLRRGPTYRAIRRALQHVLGEHAFRVVHMSIQHNHLHFLVEAEDKEQDILDKAFDVRPSSRLGCQAEVTNQDVEVTLSEESVRAWYDENPKERHERDERLLREGKAIPPPATDLRKKK